MVGDPIADFVIQIKNAGAARKESLSVPHSKMKEAVASVLKGKGFIKDLSVSGEGVKKVLEVEISYKDGKARIEGMRRVSKPSRRLYVRAHEIPKVKGGRGTAVVTTSEGVLAGVDAREKGVGGEILFEIW